MSDRLLYIGTSDGVIAMRRVPGNWEEVSVGLKGQEISALASCPGQPEEIFAGSYGKGLFHSGDAGNTWQPAGEGIAYGYIRAILVDPESPRTLLAGTEPAAIFKSEDGGRCWRELTALRNLPGHERWYLPYSPRAGAVRTIVAVPGMANSYYAGIEQGGVVFSHDGGESWQLLNNGVNEDVHQLVVDAAGGAILFAATGGGVFRSWDGGKTWESVLAEYTRTIAVQPGGTQILFAGPALQVGHLGRIVRSPDAGSTWEAWSEGLAVPLPDMVEHFAIHPGKLDDLGGLFAVLGSGDLYHCDLDRADWVPIICGGVPAVRCVAVATSER
ncbi:MAG TPA: hypothetical protein VFZ25_12830 [Chloroflexota bacterium]|nr:hypothetical protein [Chloroflexota bacterium]